VALILTAVAVIRILQHPSAVKRGYGKEKNRTGAQGLMGQQLYCNTAVPQDV
jgi:hypothetical protein